MILDWLTKDGKLIISARIIHTFSFGFLSMILAIYLTQIGFDELFIGFILYAPFVIGGMLKIVYDIGIFINFRKINPLLKLINVLQNL